ncbi:MAG: hypothetical protein KAT53_10160 [Dehalococcoidia bacterium]|nr:hypothetical protein [Dehalococcoidia bacterium]
MDNKTREFYEKCNECSFEGTIEEKRDYNGELLAVSVCPVCHGFDWMLSANWDEEDSETLDLTKEWAEQESIKILKERNIYYDIRFSKASKLILHDENINDIRQKTLELCKILNTNKADIGKHRHGIKILFPRPYGNAPTNAFQERTR